MSFSPQSYIIRDVRDLHDVKREQLEAEANILLYGCPDILEEGFERQIFSRRIYIPRNLSEPLVYKVPKQIRERLACVDCGRLHSDGGGQRCLFCYRLRVRLKYFDKREWLGYWESQMSGGWENGEPVGVVMPVTEWWDDHDIPAVPKRIAVVDWA